MNVSHMETATTLTVINIFFFSFYVEELITIVKLLGLSESLVVAL